MIHYTTVHAQGQFIVRFNHQVNAARPYQVVDLVTGQAVFSYPSLDVCLNYISDNS